MGIIPVYYHYYFRGSQTDFRGGGEGEGEGEERLCTYIQDST